MNQIPLRKKIAIEAARLMQRGQETHLGKARIRAARMVSGNWVKPANLPSEPEIRDEIERSYYVQHGDIRFDNLALLRRTARDWMTEHAAFEPRLTGAVLAGDFRHIDHIQIVFPESQRDSVLTAFAATVKTLNDDGGEAELSPDVEFMFDDGLHAVAADLTEVEHLLREQHPDFSTDDAAPAGGDRFQAFRMLLEPLAQVQQPRRSHPEGDALYHSLQVYELARQVAAYDEEFLLAALLHDVGKGIDPRDVTRASLDALAPYLTARSLWLIEQLPQAHRLLENSIGARARKRLLSDPDYELLLELVRADRAGRVAGGAAPSLDEALDDLRALAVGEADDDEID